MILEQCSVAVKFKNKITLDDQSIVDITSRVISPNNEKYESRDNQLFDELVLDQTTVKNGQENTIKSFVKLKCGERLRSPNMENSYEGYNIEDKDGDYKTLTKILNNPSQYSDMSIVKYTKNGSESFEIGTISSLNQTGPVQLLLYKTLSDSVFDKLDLKIDFDSRNVLPNLNYSDIKLKDDKHKPSWFIKFPDVINPQKINVYTDYPSEFYDYNNEKITPNQKLYKQLSQGAIHSFYSPLPGESGNSYISGLRHIDGKDMVAGPGDAIFARLKDLKIGDKYSISDIKGNSIEYTVFEIVTIDRDSVKEALKDFPGKKVITLQTDSDPNKVLLVRAQTNGGGKLDKPVIYKEDLEYTKPIYTLKPENIKYESCNSSKSIKVTQNPKVDCVFSVIGYSKDAKYLITNKWYLEIVAANRSGRSDLCVFEVDKVICKNTPTGTSDTNATGFNPSDLAIFAGGSEVGISVGSIELIY